MLHFSYSSLINAPIEKVWAFYEREDILELLSAPWQPVQVISHQGGLEVGARSHFQLMLGIIPVSWIAEHIACNKPYLFVDRQVDGPMDFWEHHHHFEKEGQATRISDLISYQIPCGLFSDVALGWWVDSRLHDMFSYRHQIIKQMLEN